MTPEKKVLPQWPDPSAAAPPGVDTVLAALRAVAEDTRLRILALLSSGELTVSELTQILEQSQPRVSRHLKLLCEAGVLDRFREGTWVFYRLAAAPGIGALARDLLRFIDPADAALQADRQRLGEVRAARSAAATAYFRVNAADWDRIRSLHVPEEQVERRLVDIVGKRPIGDLVDVGTGTGRMLELFAPLTDRAVGVDLSRDMLAVARANIDRKGLTNCQVRLGDMYDLAMADQSADLVLFHQVLHFADDPLAAIREAARILRPGGRVVVVDFAPHEFEFLRDEQAHRRLGFAAEEVTGWFRAAWLTPESTEDLKGRGKKLTVTIWAAHKPKTVEGKH